MNTEESNQPAHNLTFSISMSFVLYLGILGWVAFVDKNRLYSDEEVYIDNMAFVISNNGEFALGMSDPEWGDPFLADTSYNWIADDGSTGLTAARPPAAPFMLSLSRRLFGGQRSGGQRSGYSFFNQLLLAISLGLLLGAVRRSAGTIAALIGLMILITDQAVMTSPTTLLPDAMAIATTSLAIVFLAYACNSKKESESPGWRWFLAGTIAGLGTLVRVEVNFWMLAFLVIAVVGCVVQLARRRTIVPYLQAAGLFFFGALLVMAPWWVRNCRVTKRFAPLGTVSMNVVGGYCDAAMKDGGNWKRNPVSLIKEGIFLEAFNLGIDMDNLDIETEIGEASLAQASDWISDNGEKLPALILARLKTHFGINDLADFEGMKNVVILVLFLIGVPLVWRKFGALVAVVVIVSALTTAATWALDGRNGLPTRPLVLVMAGVAIASAVTKFNSFFSNAPAGQ